jgi:ABC-type nitrate/sulfonate/bicarbonate transport system substrate-binding protein
MPEPPDGTDAACSPGDGEIQLGMSKKMQSASLRLGFVPLTDCAPLVMAHELGLFRKFDLRVSLQRELGWATVRDKIIHRELDAAHALAPMPLAAVLGLGSVPCDCLTALVLSMNGNGITVSTSLFDCCFKRGTSFISEIRRLRREKTFTFGVVASFSSHRYLLRKWLKGQGVDPERDVRIVVVPPPQMVSNLKTGNLDGFCAGEPWNTAAAAARVGVCVATSDELDPRHPEKVLMVRREFAEKRAPEHIRLVAALLEACEWCAERDNRDRLITTLARPEYVGVSAASLRRGVEESCLFPDRNHAGPSDDKAAWTLELMRTSGLCPQPELLNMALARRAFRLDHFEQAVGLLSANPTRQDYETVRT